MYRMKYDKQVEEEIVNIVLTMTIISCKAKKGFLIILSFDFLK